MCARHLKLGGAGGRGEAVSVTLQELRCHQQVAQESEGRGVGGNVRRFLCRSGPETRGAPLSMEREERW